MLSFNKHYLRLGVLNFISNSLKKIAHKMKQVNFNKLKRKKQKFLMKSNMKSLFHLPRAILNYLKKSQVSK